MLPVLWVSLAALAAFILLCNVYVARAGSGRLYRNVEQTPRRDVGLLLGTSERQGNGGANPFFQYRIAAAVELYKAGRVRHLLVSGDNRVKNYDEPAAMKKALLAAGVPASALTLDDAGFRTLDSVVRAKKVFGLAEFTIISQQFHDERALLIARHYGIDAIGFCAQDVSISFAPKTFAREIFARVKVVLDLYVLRTKPKFLGPPIKIPL